ncbi:MAG: hypothetical protein JXQ68_06735 [Campylobacterales bacterium]|nr:hypothetical protein [Campylobacterales bacterium]
MNDSYLCGLVPLFDLDHERNIPTFYSTLVLIAATMLLFFIAYARKSLKSSYTYWFTLALIFLFLSIDEMCSLHEQLGPLLREHFKISGIFYRAWIIPYSIALAVFVIMYARFLLSLPKNIMFLFILAGTIFVVGVIGFEILGGLQKQLIGVDNALYILYFICEELFEMIGIAIFNYALLLYISDHFDLITIETKGSKKEE